MPKIVLKGFIIVPSEDLLAVKSELVRHINVTRDEPGCLVFEVTQCKTNPNHFDVYEEFIDKYAFEVHQSRAKSSCWGKVSKRVERYYETIE